MLPFPSRSYLHLFTVYSHHLPSSSSHPPVEVGVADSTLRGLQLRGCKHVTLRDVRLSNARPLFLHCVPCSLQIAPDTCLHRVGAGTVIPACTWDRQVLCTLLLTATLRLVLLASFCQGRQVQ